MNPLTWPIKYVAHGILPFITLGKEFAPGWSSLVWTCTLFVACIALGAVFRRHDIAHGIHWDSDKYGQMIVLAAAVSITVAGVLLVYVHLWRFTIPLTLFGLFCVGVWKLITSGKVDALVLTEKDAKAMMDRKMADLNTQLDESRLLVGGEQSGTALVVQHTGPIMSPLKPGRKLHYRGD